MAKRSQSRGVIRISGTSRARRLTRGELIKLAQFVAAAEKRTIAELDIAIVDADEMADLNQRYRRRRKATDVLSFDLSDRSGGPITAQIVVCLDIAAAQARRRGHSTGRELMLYVVHGMLHLTGYNDASPAAAEAMHAREDQLLSDFGAGAIYDR